MSGSLIFRNSIPGDAIPADHLTVTLTIKGCYNKVISEECNSRGMGFLQIRMHSCASLAGFCVTPFTISLENCLPSKLSKE